MSILCRGLLAALFLLLPLTAQAQPGSPLAEEEVRRFLATLPGLEELGERHVGTGLDDAEIDPEGGFSPMSSALEQIRDHAAYPEFQGLLHAEGFRDEERWAEVGDRTLRAYMAFKMEEEHPGMLDELRGALAQIESDPGMSAQQRAAMMQMMGPMLAIARSIEDVPPADLELVGAMHPEIDALVRQ